MRFLALFCSLLALSGCGGVFTESPAGRFAYSNGVLQIMDKRMAEDVISANLTNEEFERWGTAEAEMQNRYWDFIEKLDPRAKKRVPSGEFTTAQWLEVQEIANGIDLATYMQMVDESLREAGIDPAKLVRKTATAPVEGVDAG